MRRKTSASCTMRARSRDPRYICIEASAAVQADEIKRRHPQSITKRKPLTARQANRDLTLSRMQVARRDTRAAIR
jgi:hypothetical protein